MLTLKPLLPVLIVVVIALVAVAALSKKAGGKAKAAAPIRRKPAPLTKNEQPMYFRLVEAFPEHLVLAQVAFSALLDTRDRATRNRFDRKVADFVVCSKAFEVLAVVELDDSSHKGREKEDADRDTLLTNAGYRVFRYKRAPDVLTLLKDFMPLMQTPATEKTASKQEIKATNAVA